MKNSGTLKVDARGDREIVMTRAFDAPRNLVFEALTKPELLKRWLGVAMIAGLLIAIVPGNQSNIMNNQLTTEVQAMAGKTPESTKTRDVVVTRVFDAPVEQVWKAWSDREYVMQWWGPKGFTSPSAEINFREGGVSLVCMRAPKEFGGQDMYNTWTYRKIDPNKLIEFILHFTDKDGTKLDPAKMGLPPGIPQEVRHVITFKALGDNRTEMTVTEYGYPTDEAHDLSKAGLEECLDKMAAIFAKG